jgi:hypothetical protein
MSFGSKTKTTTDQQSSNTTQNVVDPTRTARQDAVWNQAQTLGNQPYNPYTEQRFEGFNRDQEGSFGMARDAATAGQGALGSAMQGTQNLMGFQPGQVQGQLAQDPSMVNAMMIGQGGFGGLTAQQIGAQNVNARTGAEGYQQYMNPYGDEVVNRSLSDIERARQDAANATRSQAAAAGAFGGSRSGVAESLTNRDFGNTAASTAANLRHQGFNTALGFNQADQNRELQAGGMNQGANLQAGMANQQASLQAGMFGQQNQLQAALANQNADLTAQRSNQQAGMQGSQFNAGQLQQAGLANQQAGIQGAGLNLNAAGLLGQQAGQQQGMMAQGADLLNRAGGQQQALGQANRDFDYQQFMQANQHPYQNLNFMNSILGSHQFGSTQNQQGTMNQTQTQQTNPGIGGALLGAGLMGASMIPGLGQVGSMAGLMGGGLTGIPYGGGAPGGAAPAYQSPQFGANFGMNPTFGG